MLAGSRSPRNAGQTQNMRRHKRGPDQWEEHAADTDLCFGSVE